MKGARGCTRRRRNHCNRHNPKTVLSHCDKLEIAVPGDRRAGLEPVRRQAMERLDRPRVSGFPEEINAHFSQTQAQTCIVQLLRHALLFAAWKDRRVVLPSMRELDRALSCSSVAVVEQC